MACPMWKHYWEVTLMYYTWCPRKCWLSALVLLLWLLLGASLFNLYSQVILWESDTVALCSRERMGCNQEWSLPHGLPLFPSLDVWVHIEPTEHTSFFLWNVNTVRWSCGGHSSVLLMYFHVLHNIITMRKTKRSVNLDCGEPYISLIFL